MRRFLAACILVAAITLPAGAHFVWVVPDATGAKIVFSDDLSPDADVSIDRVAGMELMAREATGKSVPLTCKKGEHFLAVALPKQDFDAVGGTCHYGVLQKGSSKPFLLVYCPKWVRGDVANTKPWNALPLEIVHQKADRFQVLFGGKPAADAEVVVVTAKTDKVEKIKTDAQGEFKLDFAAEGLHGVRARHIEAKAGEHKGKKYEEVRHYATLVFRQAKESATSYPPLPKAVSSFGAVACDGYLYVYGGHAGKTHSYDTENVIGTFHRLKLDSGKEWESLPGGPITQGLGMTTHAGKVYRIGGMQPRNKPGDPADNHSLAECARFDPATKKWEALPPLLAGRSSHDAVVAGDQLVVVGGWQMKGKGEKSVWHDTALILDLNAKVLKWESVPQPFQRRALTATASGSKVYVIGGLGAEGKATEIFDVAKRTWTTGPALPAEAKRAMAFSPAAATVGGRVTVNTASGVIYRLTTDGASWEKVGSAETPRIVARMIPAGPSAILLVGGASRAEGNVAGIERVTLAEKSEPAPPAGK